MSYNITLPQELAYDQVLPVLPSGAVTLDQFLPPVFTTTTQGTQMIFDLPARGMLIPPSLYLRYSYAITNSTGAFWSVMLGTPAYAPVQRVETTFGAVVHEQINNYNQTMNAMVNLTYNVGQKYGVQNMLGYGNNTTTPSLDALDGRICVTSETGTFAAPLWSLLANAEKYVPLGMMAATRITITLDRLSKFFQQTGLTATVQEVPSAFTLSNVELCYSMIDFGEGVNNTIRGFGDKLLIKSQSITNSSNTVSLASTGFQEIVFNQRLASKDYFFFFQQLHLPH